MIYTGPHQEAEPVPGWSSLLTGGHAWLWPQHATQLPAVCGIIHQQQPQVTVSQPFLFYDNYSSRRSQSASHFYFTNKQSENQSAVILLMIIMLLKQSETERGPERLCRINKEGLERCHTNTNQRPELSTVTHLACE